MKNINIILKEIDFKNILAFTITVIWLYLHIICVSNTCEIDKELLSNFNMIETMIIGYYFGSSYNSSKKDNLLKEVNEQLGKKKCEEKYE